MQAQLAGGQQQPAAPCAGASTATELDACALCGWQRSDGTSPQAPMLIVSGAPPAVQVSGRGKEEEEAEAGPGMPKLKRCGRCQAVHYCCAACQAAHWRGGHKEVCKAPPAKPPAQGQPQ